MSRVIADQPLRERLHNLESSVEICDEAGRTLGFFLTREEYEKMMMDWVNLKYTEEEIERIRAEPGEDLTTAEMMARFASA